MQKWQVYTKIKVLRSHERLWRSYRRTQGMFLLHLLEVDIFIYEVLEYFYQSLLFAASLIRRKYVMAFEIVGTKAMKIQRYAIVALTRSNVPVRMSAFLMILCATKNWTVRTVTMNATVTALRLHHTTSNSY